MTETDAMIREIEDQRNMMATRCARLAAQIAALQNALVAKDKIIGELQAKTAPKEVDDGA